MKGWMAGALAAVVLAGSAEAQDKAPPRLDGVQLGWLVAAAEACDVPLSQDGLRRITIENGRNIPDFLSDVDLGKWQFGFEYGPETAADRTVACTWAHEAAKTYGLTAD